MSADKSSYNKEPFGAYLTHTGLTDLSDNLIANEDSRIDSLKDTVDERYDTFERNKDLKVSDTKRRQSWQWIYMVALAGGILAVILVILRFLYPAIYGIDTVMVLVVSGCLIYILILYLEIQNRSPTNFDKVNQTSYLMSQIESESKNSSYGITEAEECEGADCCKDNNSFDRIAGKCQADAFQGMHLQEGFYGNINNLNFPSVSLP